MSPLVASLLLFSGFVAAQINAPDCSLTWKWSFNSLGQNACTVAAYMMSTCNGGSFTISALQPGYSYTGPSGVDNSNLCKCNTIAYSLISACDACQGAEWITWSEYVTNCTKTLPASSFPNPIPSGTRVPQWAILDVTSENNWNSNKSYSVGDSPELAPGTLLGPSGITVSTTGSGSHGTSTSSGDSSTGVPTPTPTKKSSSNTGAIVGGVVGGVAAIAIGAFAVAFFLLRRKRSQAPAAAPGFGASQPPMDEIQRPLTDEGMYTASSLPGTLSSPPGTMSSLPGTPIVPMRLYDPNDPTTFPGYEGIPQSPATPPQGPVPSNSGTGNSLATMQNSRPQGAQGGYHGLPTV